MSQMEVFSNAVPSVEKPATLLMLLPRDQTSWCQQFAQEGYNVVHLTYPLSANASFKDAMKVVGEQILALGADWGLLTYGLTTKDAETLVLKLALSLADLKACAHFCPDAEDTHGFLLKDSQGRHVPVTFHLASSQEVLHASLLLLEDPANLGYSLPTHSRLPVRVYSYPLVSKSPPFPFSIQPPVSVKAGDQQSIDPYLRSASSLSLTRTLELLKSYLGPHFNLERLWEMHTYYQEFIERDAPKTMSTMVATPYVNHVPTMTGGVGYEELARFYKYHFTTVTPQDFELITVSRTVGCDRIVDEMIFKCHHTSEIDYFLPGIAPTGKYIQIAMVGIIAFRGDKLFFEHLYWDQAGLLAQLGLLDPSNLPVAGIEVPRKVLDPFGMPSNTLLKRWHESEGLPID
ncbi:NTF2-like protein [Rhizopogon vinicolor AM-OR11-026]|uniref:NTF2-like protein n=1 Tax=Rhizopogon vinicolor AM-OR11-026 TaxID=1314800 RepID=A0A1B7NHC3_9AGAM|nr:NTF2-like protein [Rhizopogon vinicolor AM-OR11-026]